MTNFDFISHESFDDKYIKEIVYVLVNGLRIAFVHKCMQNGGSYWDVMSNSLSIGLEKKESYKAVKFGDAFLIDDIKDYLRKRKWEAKYTPNPALQAPKAGSINEVAEDEQLPF